MVSNKKFSFFGPKNIPWIKCFFGHFACIQNGEKMFFEKVEFFYFLQGVTYDILKCGELNGK
jgi:hypothetical protein